MKEDPFKDNKNAQFMFSFFFSIFLVYFLQQSAFLMIIFNLIFLPFNLIHELGHLLAIYCFLPEFNPSLELHLIQEGLCSNNIPLEELPASWGSIFFKLTGSFIVLLVSLTGFFMIRNKTDERFLLIKNFLIFGIFIDLPNLFPILPAMLGSVNDGYGISILLLRMGYSTYPTFPVSFIFSCLTALMALISFFYLGNFIYYLFTLPRIKLQNQITTLMESHGM